MVKHINILWCFHRSERECKWANESALVPIGTNVNTRVNQGLSIGADVNVNANTNANAANDTVPVPISANTIESTKDIDVPSQVASKEEIPLFCIQIHIRILHV